MITQSYLVLSLVVEQGKQSLKHRTEQLYKGTEAYTLLSALASINVSTKWFFLLKDLACHTENLLSSVFNNLGKTVQLILQDRIQRAQFPDPLNLKENFNIYTTYQASFRKYVLQIHFKI